MRAFSRAEKCQAEKRRCIGASTKSRRILLPSFYTNINYRKMARATRRTTPRAPLRALRSRSLGAGTRNDNGPGSRASSRVQNVVQAAAGEAANAGEVVDNRNRSNNRGDQVDLKAMRVEQARIRLEGKVPGYAKYTLYLPWLRFVRQSFGQSCRILLGSSTGDFGRHARLRELLFLS